MPKVTWLDASCHSCGARLNSWDMKVSRALRYRNAVCEKCVAKEYGKEVGEVREIMEDFFGMRPCQGI